MRDGTERTMRLRQSISKKNPCTPYRSIRLLADRLTSGSSGQEPHRYSPAVDEGLASFEKSLYDF